MKPLQRILCLLLALGLFLGLLTGCRSSGPDSGTVSNGSSAAAPTDDSDREGDGGGSAAPVDLHIYGYDTVDTGLDALADSFDPNCVILDGRFYTIGYRFAKGDGDSDQILLLSVGLDGSDPQAVALPAPASNEKQSGTLTGLMADDNGDLYTICSVLQYATEETDAVQTFSLMRLSADGSADEPVPLQGLDGRWLDTNNATYYDGTWYFPIYNEIIAIAPDGAVRTFHPLGEDASIQLLYRCADGSVMIGYYIGEEWSFHLRPIDLVTGELGKEWQLPDTLMNPKLTTDADGGLYLYDMYGLYRYDADARALSPLCSWLDSGIDYTVAVGFVAAMGDGTFLAVGNGGGTGDKRLLTRLSPIDPAALPAKTVVRLGCTNSETLRAAVLAFNRSSTTTHVTVVDYSIYNHENNQWGGGLKQLDAELTAGDGPDILLIETSMPFQSYLNRGLFADLYPLLDADPQLSREDLLPNILTACETDGRLTSILPAYDIFTAAAPAALVGTEMGWTWEEFFAALDTMPELPYAFSNTTKRAMLVTALMLSGGRLVDAGTGACSFDSSAFRQMLEYAVTYPAEMSSNRDETLQERFAAGQMLLHEVLVTDFTGICSEVYNMNGPAVYKGFPTVDGTDGSAAIPQLQLAILEGCADKAAAWEFVRTFLTPEYQQSITNHLPLRLDALQQRAEEAMLPLPENESPSDGRRPTTQAEADQTMALITSVSTVYQWDNALLVMAQEEADGFFDGSRTAEETASALQSRAEAYFRENR